MNTICRSRWFLLTAVLTCVITFGCGSADEARDAHHDDHNEQEPHDQEHLEHFVPAHKPKDFSALVDQLALRFPQLGSAGSNADSSNPGENARHELADIIGWIPELAADSDLKKADFESAVVAADKLSRLFKDTQEAPNGTPVEGAVLDSLIAELRELVLKSQGEQN